MWPGLVAVPVVVRSGCRNVRSTVGVGSDHGSAFGRRHGRRAARRRAGPGGARRRGSRPVSRVWTQDGIVFSYPLYT